MLYVYDYFNNHKYRFWSSSITHKSFYFPKKLAYFSNKNNVNIREFFCKTCKIQSLGLHRMTFPLLTLLI